VSHLDLRQNPLGDEGIKIFSKALPKSNSLIHLDIRSTALTKEGIQYLYKGLLLNQTVTCLLLGNVRGMYKNYIAGDAMCGIDEYLKKSMQLNFLDLNGAHIGDNGLPYLLSGLLKSQSLCMLNLSSNNLTGLSSANLVDIITKTHVTKLDLSYNSLGTAFIDEFYGNTLYYKYPLTALSLSSCGFSNLKLGKLFQALRRGAYLRQLEINNTKYKITELIHLRSYLSNATTLRSFSSSNCEFGDEGAIHIAEAYIKDWTLNELNLSNNLITDRGAIIFANNLALTETFNLKSLDLSHNRIEVFFIKKLVG